MNRARVFLAVCFLACAAPVLPQESPSAAGAVSLEDLLVDAQQYATTEAKRAAKRRAKDELFARGAEGLEFLLGQVHLENVMVRVLADEAVNRLPADQAVPVLLRRIEDPRPETRGLAVYWLGLYRTPEHAPRVLPLLDDPDARRMAVRTLGKWRVRDAVERLALFLTDSDERLRVAAANALRDIGDPRAAPALLAALDDPVFTVRKTAARALACLGRESDESLFAALSGASVRVRREIIGLFAARPSPRTVAALRACLEDPEPMVRLDAARVLLALEPRSADRWLKERGIVLPPGAP
jgi:HEAT repeat protein